MVNLRKIAYASLATISFGSMYPAMILENLNYNQRAIYFTLGAIIGGTMTFLYQWENNKDKERKEREYQSRIEKIVKDTQGK